jgi:regulator of sirC expression with transglutaminase-like and TPR domain
MPRKTRRPPEVRVPTGIMRPVLWPRYAAIALVFAGLGAGAMYAALRPALHRAALRGNRPVVINPPLASPTATAPPADLTAGLAPDKAAVALGNWYEDHKQWAQAVASYTQAINSAQDNPDVRTDLGVAYYEAGQPQNALAQYQAAQQQDPAHENSLFNQGSVYAITGDVPKAIDIWRTYIQRFPQGQHVADARQLIAQMQRHGGQLPLTPGTGANAPTAPSAAPAP